MTQQFQFTTKKWKCREIKEMEIYRNFYFESISIKAEKVRG